METTKETILTSGSKSHPEKVNICGREYDLAGMPDYKRNYLERLSKVGTSPLKAVRLKCAECSGYDIREAKRCKLHDCALFALLWNREQRRAAGASAQVDEEDLEDAEDRS